MVLLSEKVLEFVLPSPEIEGVFSLVEKRVHFLFNVLLTRSLQDQDLERSHQWLKLEGNGDDINLAKEYIIAVCCPEEHANLILPDDGRNQLLGMSDRGCLIDSIEKQSGAYLGLKEEGHIEVRGSSFAVALALSLLEGANLVLNDNNNSTQVDCVVTEEPSSVIDNLNFSGAETISSPRSERLEPETPRTLSQEETSKNHSSKETECGSTLQQQECAETADIRTMTRQKCQTVVNSDKMVDSRNEENQSVEESEGDSNESPANESLLRDYALKLGYSEPNITLGLSKLGISADKNSLVEELLKAQSSVKQLEEGPSSFSPEKYLTQVDDPHCLRPIVIDGSNVAMSHGNQKVFSCRGIGITVDWFLKRNHHDIKVFVPSWRKESPKPDSPIINQEVLVRLEQDELLVWTPSRKINGRRVTCYDDRYIVKHAAQNDGIIVSNDTFRDLQNESHEWKKVIELRLLMYTFVDDKFMPPDDPLGRHGPTLDEFLKRGYGKLCSYGKKCTYGRRCKYLHPERTLKSEGDPPNIELKWEGRYGEASRPERPLPPCPPEALRTYHKPPLEIPPHILSKPLPLPPYWELAANMSQIFPPTLRTNQPVAVGQRRPTSDPLPVHKELPPDIQLMQESFQRTHSLPALEDQACGGALQLSVGPMQRRGSLPQVCTLPPYQEIMARGRTPVPGMSHDGGEWMLQEQIYGRQNYQFPPHCHQNPPVSGQAAGYESHQQHSLLSPSWSLHPYPQQSHPYPLHPQSCQFNPGNGSFYAPSYGRTPYRGQHNGYFRSRAPPIIHGEGYEVIDSSKDCDASHEEQRIKAYEKLCELFPDEGEKILRVMDEFSCVSSVEELTQHILDDANN